MKEIEMLLVGRAIAVEWKARLVAGIATSDGGYVLGSFSSTTDAEEMLEGVALLKSSNVRLIDFYTEAFRNDCLDFASIGEAVLLTQENVVLDNQISELNDLLLYMSVS